MTDDEDRGNTGSLEAAPDEDLTAADIEQIHTLVDDLSDEEREQLGREAEAGGGPLTEALKATIMLASRSRAGDRSSEPRANG